MPGSNVVAVLAHGAWTDGSSWRRVVAGLRSKGVRAVAAPLPLTSLADDVAALDRTLELVDGPAVLVGHAYAGAVIASTADRKVASLVYVAALAPDEGETVADLFYRARPHPDAPQLGPDRHELIWLPEDAFARAFAQQATAEEQAELAAAQRPLAARSIGVPVGRPVWRDRPSWFLVAEEDRMIPAETQRFAAERMGAKVRTAPVDHMPMLTAPSVVTDIVLEAVREVDPGR
ncbi:alpha/beta hydrolase [Streptomyces sulfonofaciens]|uniref:Alpha/beta hydrolase n=1 Tax=Streptomyces sulfonofaciens TaxID=68272 RepID=A0A919L304_9ACTN|nr:alpha/beta hydrolase [Streptomyces sulfonofaciens]GHH82063.1 alpha/beta hydrolase [Streptomyces sulfonofaciens]